MFRKLLALLGYEIRYVHPWGTWKIRYSGIDAAMMRPVHPNMAVAPPTATMLFSRIK